MAMVNIDMTNGTTSALPQRRLFIFAAKKALEQVVCLPRAARLRAQVSVVLSDTRTVRRLNRQYRRVDRPTDVLSFPRFMPSPASVRKGRNSLKLGKISPMPDPDGVVRLGEIVIAPAVARREAAGFGHGEREHLVFLFVHGLLHLLGFDHEASSRDAQFMDGVQERVVKSLRNGMRL
jgi:probable rRNA maturation factor